MKFRNNLKAGSILAACAIAASIAGCEKPNGGTPGPNGPDVGLNNQIMLDENTVDIKTAIYSQENEIWTFWLSPHEDLFLVEEIEKTDDYLKVVAKNPQGTVDVAKNLISLEYKDVKVTGKTAVDFTKVELQAHPIISGDKIVLNFYTYVENKTGQKLIARYNGSIAPGIGEVSENTWQIDGKAPVRIQSAVKWTKMHEFTEYFLFAEEGKTEPASESESGKYIKISVASDLKDETIDLATADREKLRITCDGMDVMNGAEGTLKIAGDNNKVNLDLNSKFDNNGTPCILRANTSIIPSIGYYADGKLNIKHTTTFENEIDLKKVYHNASNKIGYEIAFGLKADTKEMTDLMDPDARYAVSMIISNEDVKNGKTNMLNAANKRLLTLKVFDYKEFVTYDFATTEVAGDWHGGEAEVTVQTVGKDKLYIYLDATFGWSKDTPDSKKGLPFVKLEWFGQVTDIMKWKDLTPSRPALDCFIAKAKPGTDFESSQLYKEITGFSVVKNDNASVQGAKMATYDFTFTMADESQIVLNYKQSDVNQGAIEIPSRADESWSPNAETFLFKLEFKDNWTYWGSWNFMNSGQITNTWCGTGGPKEGTIDINNSGDTWKILIDFKNSYTKWGMDSGDGEMVKLQFEGKASNN